MTLTQDSCTSERDYHFKPNCDMKKICDMYNLNISLAEAAANAANSLLVENSSVTPKTPEILNSLISMTNPLDYTFGDKRSNKNSDTKTMSSDSNSSSSTESPTHKTPSILHTRSQLVKAGLKLSIEQKRKFQSDGEDLFDMDKCKRIKKQESESEDDRQQESGITGLTLEDEERRRRRRERNKIAATKCRLKKREKTANLITESETLETQNIDLKKQFQELQNQKANLMEMLSIHRPQCQQSIGPATKDKLYQISEIDSFRLNQSIEMSSNKLRHPLKSPPNIVIERVNDSYDSRIDYSRADSYGKIDSYDSRIGSFESRTLTDLDSQLSSMYFAQCHNNNYDTDSYMNKSNGCTA